MQASRLLVATALLAAAATAQLTHVIPNGMATAEGSTSNAFPWGRGSAASLQIQTIYDTTHFTAASINYPIVISRLRWRTNGNVAAGGGSYTTATVEMASATVDAMAPGTSFAGNMGPDRTVVYSGPVTQQSVPAATPGNWFVDIPLSPAFVYDPSQGNDLVIFSDIPPGVGGAAQTLQMDVHATNALASRVFNSTAYGSGSGTVNANHGVVVELTYVPAQGLYPDFAANVTAGAAPLAVSFTDRSFSSAPGGVIAWLWDIDNDTVVDYTVQNPTHTYTACGRYSVNLTVIDSTHPPGSVTKTNYISVDPINAAFTSTQPGGFAPHTVNFTDTSTGPVTSWAWDLDGDNVTDTTLQNPSWAYGPGTYNVRLTVTNGCFSDTETRTAYVNVLAPGAMPAPPELFQYQFNEVRGTQVANTATTNAAPATGAVLNNATWQTDPGRAGFRGNEAGFGCLGYRVTGAAAVNTGWTTNVTGSFSVAWWMRKDPNAAATPFGYAFGNGTFRSFVGGAAGTGVTFRGSAIGNVDSGFTVNGTPGVWQHVALVVDDTAGQALWYSNGTPSATVVTFTPNTFSYASTLLFGVGSISSAGSSPFGAGYDMDDFRFYTRALLPVEVMILSVTAENASSGVFSGSCPGTMGTPTIAGVGRPTLGNATYAVSLGNAENSRLAGLVMGFTPAAWGTFDLSPFLGAGCTLGVPWGQALFHVTAGNGATQALPIPNNPALSGWHVYAQWLIAGTTGATSQALDINIQ